MSGSSGSGRAMRPSRARGHRRTPDPAQGGGGGWVGRSPRGQAYFKPAEGRVVPADIHPRGGDGGTLGRGEVTLGRGEVVLGGLSRQLLLPKEM